MQYRIILCSSIKIWLLRFKNSVIKTAEAKKSYGLN